MLKVASQPRGGGRRCSPLELPKWRPLVMTGKVQVMRKKMANTSGCSRRNDVRIRYGNIDIHSLFISWNWGVCDCAKCINKLYLQIYKISYSVSVASVHVRVPSHRKLNTGPDPGTKDLSLLKVVTGNSQAILDKATVSKTKKFKANKIK